MGGHHQWLLTNPQARVRVRVSVRVRVGVRVRVRVRVRVCLTVTVTLTLTLTLTLTNPQEALANGCRIANAAVRADILRAEPAARLCRSAGGYVPMVHLGGGRYRADTSGTTMAFCAVLRGEKLVFASLGDSPLLLMGT